MKTIGKGLLISLVPLFTPFSAFAETERQAERLAPKTTTNDSAAGCRGSELMGNDVNNQAGDTLGKVEDVILDMESKEILAVVISSGGFLGIGDTLSVVPVTALRYEGADKALMTRLTKKQLGKAPQFKSNAWPDYSKPATLEELRDYRESLGDNVTASAHTEQNMEKRSSVIRTNRYADKDSSNRTGGDERSKDVQMTADIRSGIMDEELSYKAKKIQIVTRDGNVTLKGAVESEDEREAILKVAGNHAEESKVTDELKVESK